jgi:hypothetical protein
MKIRVVIAATASCIALGLAASPASAQATRTWVSGVGDDVNPCSRTAPCKTFAGAISKTAAGGEINCLDPGGFGAVTIIKAMTINCLYTEGGVLAGGNGIVVNAGPTDVVFLRGLDIFGVNPPTNGVRIVAGGTVHIEDCTIRRFNAANSQGISFQPSGATRLYISNTTIAENGNGATGGGILIAPTGAGGSGTVVMSNVRIENNANNGLRVDTAGTTSPTATVITMNDSVVTGSTTGISLNTVGGGTSIGMFADRVSVVYNTGTGVTASNNAVVRFSNSLITGNATGIQPTGIGQIQSFGGNRLLSNPSVGAANNGTFTATNIPS